MPTAKKGKFFFLLHILFTKKRGKVPENGVGGIHMRNFGFLGGGLIGLANGLFGGGGGMIAVPVLRAQGRDARHAHAAAIAVMLPASALSAAVYALRGYLSLSLLLPVLLGAVAGGLLGARLLFLSSSKGAALLFSAVMLAAGVRMVLP